MHTLRLLAAAVSSLLLTAPAAAQPSQLVIRVWSFGFAPNPVHLAAGVPVRITFVNQSGSSHDFTAAGFFHHARLVSGAADGDEVDLRPHETKTLTLIPGAGTYHAHCSHFLHKQLGMEDLIIVD